MLIDVSNVKIKYNKQKEKYGYDFRYNGKRYQSFKWDSERKAKSALIQFINDLEKGLTTSNIRFTDLCETYYKFIAGSLNKNTLTTKKQVIAKHITPTFGIRKIKSITINDLSEFLLSLLDLKYTDNDGEKKYYSNDFLDRIQTELWGIFNFANIHGYIINNPTLKLNRVRHNTYQPKKKFYRVPASDAYKVINAAHNQQTKVMLLLSYEHGMRPSEIAGLDIEDIDFDNNIIHIKQAWKSKDNELTPTKNGEDRYNATSKRVLDAIQGLLDEYNEQGGYRTDMSLFGLTRRPSSTTMSTWKKKAIDAAGVKHFTWYDLRHTHVTDLLDAGFKPYQVAERMGHDEIQTLDYAIVDIKEQFDMVNALENNRNSNIDSSPKSHQNKSKDEIMTEINRLMELLK